MGWGGAITTAVSQPLLAGSAQKKFVAVVFISETISRPGLAASEISYMDEAICY